MLLFRSHCVSLCDPVALCLLAADINTVVDTSDLRFLSFHKLWCRSKSLFRLISVLAAARQPGDWGSLENICLCRD
jgi:hypothetical protein